jgi:hypothetical protein
VARTKKNLSILAGMCSRLTVVMDLLAQSDAQLSKYLGYVNQTTLAKTRRGETFPDVERLHRLGQLSIDGAQPNLHWVIAGHGSPFVVADGVAGSAATASALSTLANARARQTIDRLSHDHHLL